MAVRCRQGTDHKLGPAVPSSGVQVQARDGRNLYCCHSSWRHRTLCYSRWAVCHRLPGDEKSQRPCCEIAERDGWTLPKNLKTTHRLPDTWPSLHQRHFRERLFQRTRWRCMHSHKGSDSVVWTVCWAMAIGIPLWCRRWGWVACTLCAMGPESFEISLMQWIL